MMELGMELGTPELGIRQCFYASNFQDSSTKDPFKLVSTNKHRNASRFFGALALIQMEMGYFLKKCEPTSQAAHSL